MPNSVYIVGRILIVQLFLLGNAGAQGESDASLVIVDGLRVKYDKAYPSALFDELLAAEASERRLKHGSMRIHLSSQGPSSILNNPCFDNEIQVTNQIEFCFDDSGRFSITLFDTSGNTIRRIVNDGEYLEADIGKVWTISAFENRYSPKNEEVRNLLWPYDVLFLPHFFPVSTYLRLVRAQSLLGTLEMEENTDNGIEALFRPHDLLAVNHCIRLWGLTLKRAAMGLHAATQALTTPDGEQDWLLDYDEWVSSADGVCIPAKCKHQYFGDNDSLTISAHVDMDNFYVNALPSEERFLLSSQGKTLSQNLAADSSENRRKLNILHIVSMPIGAAYMRVYSAIRYCGFSNEQSASLSLTLIYAFGFVLLFLGGRYLYRHHRRD